MWINILGQITKPRINWDTNCSWVTRSRWERNKGHCHFPFSHSWSNVPYINLLKATRSLPTTVPPCVSLNPRCSHSLLIVPRHISLCRLVWWMRFPLQLISQFFFFLFSYSTFSRVPFFALVICLLECRHWYWGIGRKIPLARDLFTFSNGPQPFCTKLFKSIYCVIQLILPAAKLVLYFKRLNNLGHDK